MPELTPFGCEFKLNGYRDCIVMTTADVMLVEFTRRVDELRCAADVQSQMAERIANVQPKA